MCGVPRRNDSDGSRTKYIVESNAGHSKMASLRYIHSDTHVMYFPAGLEYRFLQAVVERNHSWPTLQANSFMTFL